MAELVQELSVHVQESAGDDNQTQTSFGLPGSGTGHAKYCNTDYYVDVHVYDDLSVQAKVHGSFTATVLANNYEVAFVLNPAAFEFSYDDGHLAYPGGATVMATGDVDANKAAAGTGDMGDFVWDIDSGFLAVGHLWDFGASDTGTDGYLWVGGTGTYPLDDILYPVPVRITVPGFMKYLGYYPWARYGDGKYKSCNRTGGSLMQVRGGAYADVRNSERDHSVDRAFYYGGGKWNSCLKIGEE